MGQKKAKSEAQLYAEDPNATTLRSWAQYNGFPEDNLEQRAAVLARQELSNTIATLVTGSIENYGDTYRASEISSNSEGISKRQTLSSGSKDKVSAVTQELLRGSRIAKSERYIQPDGTETAYVCVELALETLINNLQSNKELHQVISENEKLYIDWRSEQFSQSMQDEFETLKEAKGLN